VRKRIGLGLVTGAILLAPVAAVAGQGTNEKRVCWSAEERSRAPVRRMIDDPESSLFAILLNAEVAMDARSLLAVVGSSDDPKMRLTALFALKYCDRREARARLEALLERDWSALERKALLTTLLSFRSSKAMRIVATILDDENTDDRTRIRWYPAFVRAGGDCDLAFVGRMASSPDSAMRHELVAVAWSLLEQPEHSMLAAMLLHASLRDPSKSVRREALSAIVNVALAEPRDDLCVLLSEAKDLLVEPKEVAEAEMWSANFREHGICPPAPGASR